MAVFYSFHYERDHWRVQQVMRMGVVEGQPLLNSQKWEEVKRRGDKAVETWISENMKNKSAVVVLVGAQTAQRRWVRHEIIKAWNDKRPLVGVRIHGLADNGGKQDRAGANPFDIKLDGGGNMSTFVPLRTPAGSTSQQVYASIQANLKDWIAGAYKRT